MLRWLALLAGLAVACSYSLDLPHCKVTCGGPADCPSNSTCRSGFCQRGAVDECVPDAATTSTGGAMGTGGATGGSPGTGGATGGSPGTGGVMSTGGAPGTGGVMSTGGAPGTGGVMGTGGLTGTGGVMGTGGMPARSDGGASACGTGCGAGTICCMPPWMCAGMCIPDCRPSGTCMMNDVCDTISGFCQPDCRKMGNNCPPGSGLTCNASGLCR
jgi:hypothetical protein